ncbi:hypothetical protein C5167_050719 [Papaver somniferum]|uniref:Transmembrane protein n=1 Tax=Papaver somniferum TaxID=3469 RepID=A0A4Y7KPI0_PAPSO|nr:uncharacterized protein LOC113303585 [Papaver somniferum]RZC75243.1 hypothetical protein C5167_050719 [Papaver somniferum]
MQRQSLGGSSSPSSKLHLCEENDEEDKRKSQRLVVTDSDIDEEDENEDEIRVVVKKKKILEKSVSHHHHRSSSFTQTEKSIHLIPILTIFCILILYLVSYDPSQKDLANIDGFRKTTSKQLDSEEIDLSDLRRGGGDVLEIRSHRSLHEIHHHHKDHHSTNNKNRSRLHRKMIGDF